MACGRRRVDGRHAGRSSGRRCSPSGCGRSVAIATTTQSSAQQIAWSTVGRRAILDDPGLLLAATTTTQAPGDGPHRGLAVARQIAHIHYRSERAFAHKFGRRLLEPLDAAGTFSLDQRFDVEGYLDYQGVKLVDRFDANSYLRLNKAMDLHDLGRGRGGVAARPSPGCARRRW